MSMPMPPSMQAPGAGAPGAGGPPGGLPGGPPGGAPGGGPDPAMLAMALQAGKKGKGKKHHKGKRKGRSSKKK